MNDDLRLLVVDDEPVICQACRRVFTRQGFAVEESTDAQEGLARATEGNFSAILLDIKMPGMDGIQFLQELRKTQPDVPVMIMTGYPSIPNAASAVQLGASDYITKPFTPEGITQTVRRILASHTDEEPARPEAPATIPVRRLFYDESWLQLEADGSATVGAILFRSQPLVATSVRLPAVGEVVYQGLPLAGLVLQDGSVVAVPSPISGVVVSANERLADDPSILLDDPCGEGWIACICTTRLEEELDHCTARRLILLNGDEATSAEQCEKLESLGCEVQAVTDWAQLPPMARRPEYTVLVFDAASFADRGPELLERINADAPSLRVVVVASPGSRWETAYREQKIFYYAVEPFGDNEISQILNAAFRRFLAGRQHEANHRGPSEPLGGVRITNRNGQKVQLLAAPGLLHRGRGLGEEIVERLRNRSLPVVTLVGTGDIEPATVLRAANAYDRVMVLRTNDTGHLPGSLVRDTKAEYVCGSRENAGKVTTLAVQPAGADDGLTPLDPRTTEALAKHIVQEMASY